MKVINFEDKEYTMTLPGVMLIGLGLSVYWSPPNEPQVIDTRFLWKDLELTKKKEQE